MGWKTRGTPEESRDPDVKDPMKPSGKHLPASTRGGSSKTPSTDAVEEGKRPPKDALGLRLDINRSSSFFT
eukprot:scaffold2383_cov161-Amphora_coffeaeformis.AAC.17